MTLAGAGALSRTLFARGLAIEPAPVISPPVLIAFPAVMALANAVAAGPPRAAAIVLQQVRVPAPGRSSGTAGWTGPRWGRALPSPATEGIATTPGPRLFDAHGGGYRVDLTSDLRRLGVPGLSAAVVRQGTIVSTPVAGVADLNRNKPVTPDTVFTWASVSKIVTATALMQLFDDKCFIPARGS